MRAGFGITTAVVLALALAPAAAPAQTPVTASGSCEQPGVILTVPTERVREWVPPGFPIYEVAGRSPLFATGVRCDRHTIDGVTGPNTYGLVSVFSDHPDGLSTSEFGHAYDLWWLNSTAAAADAYDRLGFTNELAPAIHASIGAGAATFDALGAERFPFRVDVRTVPALVPPAGLGATLDTYHWHVGPNGRALIDPHHTGMSVRGGLGTVTAPAGSPLARIMGTTRASGPGGTLRFDFTGAYGPA